MKIDRIHAVHVEDSIDNRKVVRSRDDRMSKDLLWIGGVVLILAALFIAYGWPRAVLRDAGSMAGRLQREHLRLFRQLPERGLRRIEFTIRQHRRKDAFDQACAVLGADRREVAPGFAPAGDACIVFRAHEHRRPVMHHAERSAHGRLDRATEHERFERADPHGLRSICRWM